MGQTSNGLRWPYGPVAIITPFNFPLEIPALQLMGALYMGNKPLLHVDQKVCVWESVDVVWGVEVWTGCGAGHCAADGHAVHGQQAAAAHRPEGVDSVSRVQTCTIPSSSLCFA